MTRLRNILCLGGICVALLASSCRRASGPVLVNASGTVAHVASSYEDGRTIEGDLETGRLLWSGYTGSPISSATIRIGDGTFTLSAVELRTPFEGDKWAAFILKKDGPQKVKLEEAFAAADRR